MTNGSALELDGIGVGYRVRGKSVPVVRDITLRVDPGETLGIVGESGCGKTTLVRAIMRLLPATTGRIRILGRDVTALRGRELRRARVDFQMVQQDPYSGLDPRIRIGRSLREVLQIFHRGDQLKWDEKIAASLSAVALDARTADKFPHQLSGGQLQRASIARAFLLDPRLVVLDEPTSALDVSIQAQVVNLLLDLQDERKAAYVFVTHDLALIREVATQVAVMFGGTIVEHGATESVFTSPAHPYTAALLATVPAPEARGARQVETGIFKEVRHDEEQQQDVSGGCPYRARCGLFHALDRPARCLDVPPLLRTLEGGRQSACHFAEVALGSGPIAGGD